MSHYGKCGLISGDLGSIGDDVILNLGFRYFMSYLKFMQYFMHMCVCVHLFCTLTHTRIFRDHSSESQKGPIAPHKWLKITGIVLYSVHIWIQDYGRSRLIAFSNRGVTVRIWNDSPRGPPALPLLQVRSGGCGLCD